MTTPRHLLTEAILTTADYLRAWGVTLPDDLETDLETLKAVRLRRDRREPGQAEKATAEERVAAIFRRIFKRQRAQVLEKLQAQYPDRKALKFAWDQPRDEQGRFAGNGDGGTTTEEVPAGARKIGDGTDIYGNKTPVYEIDDTTRLIQDYNSVTVGIRGTENNLILGSSGSEHESMLSAYGLATDMRPQIDNCVRFRIYNNELRVRTVFAGEGAPYTPEGEKRAINNIYKAASKLVSRGLSPSTPLVIEAGYLTGIIRTTVKMVDIETIKHIAFATKADIDDWLTFAADDPDLAALIAELIEATRGGINLFGQRSQPTIDWTLTNAEAARRAREYTYELVRGINQTSQEALQQVIAAFVETPGMTLGQVEAELAAIFPPLIPGEAAIDRAARIAITEITRAYAGGEVMAGEALREEFPGVRIVKKWYTREDERVCLICGPLGEAGEIELSETWTVDGEEYDQPPAHVNCRCALETSTALAELD